MSNCWKCQSPLLRIHDEWCCKTCGATQHPQSVPSTDPPVRKQPYQAGTTGPSLAKWVSQNKHQLGSSSIVKVRRILLTLPSPFMKYQSNGPLSELTLPCFTFDREYRNETATIVSYKRKKHRDALLSKNENINKLLRPMSMKNRAIAKVALWLCDERNREVVMLEDCKIRWFFRVIEWEQRWLELYRELVRVRRSWNRTSLFEEELSTSVLNVDHDLFKTTLFDVQTRVLRKSKLRDPREQRFEHIQREIDKARAIVTKAAAALEPAKSFYGSPQPSRPVKHALMELMISLSPDNKRKAALALQELLHIADPKRPAKESSLRVMHYGR
jgi:hypothetical protein